MSMTTDELHEMRVRVCSEVSAWLASHGVSLWQFGYFAESDDIIGLGVASQMVGQVGEEAVDAFVRERWYAGSCLVRQVVEAQYLLAYFASDTKQAGRWLNATPGRLQKSFRPSALRAAGGFSGTDYALHCRWGGHPTPEAKHMLPNHELLAHSDFLWIDLAQHLSEAAHYIALATADSPLVLETFAGLTPEENEELGEVIHGPPRPITEWRNLDPLAERLPRELSREEGPALVGDMIPHVVVNDV